MAEETSVPRFPEDGILSAQTTAAKAQKSQMTGKPRFSFPGIAASPSTRDQLLQALMGFSSGGQAALQASNLGDPLVSFLAGFGGAAQGFQQGGQAIQQAQLAQIENIPLTEQDFPGLAQKFPELIGIPLGMVQKIAPAVSRTEAIENQLQTFLLGESGRNIRAQEERQLKRDLDNKSNLQTILDWIEKNKKGGNKQFTLKNEGGATYIRVQMPDGKARWVRQDLYDEKTMRAL